MKNSALTSPSQAEAESSIQEWLRLPSNRLGRSGFWFDVCFLFLHYILKFLHLYILCVICSSIVILCNQFMLPEEYCICCCFFKYVLFVAIVVN